MQERTKTMHVQVLTNIDFSTNNQKIAEESSDIVSRAVDGMPGRGSVDFRRADFEIGNQPVAVFLYAETEPHHVKNINYYFIFLKNIAELDNPTIKLNNNGKLSVPAIHAGSNHYIHEIDPNKKIVLLVGNKSFTSEDKEKARDYAKKNHLSYAGECDLTASDLGEAMQQFVSKAIDVERVRKAYAKGASSGAFKGIFPSEIGEHIGSFLEEGEALSRTRKAAHKRARGAKEYEEEKLNRPKLK